MPRFFSEVRIALRQWLRHPAAALVIVLSIAAGIGANATVFAWINGVILRPLPGTQPARELLAFENRAPDGAIVSTSFLDYRDLRDRARLSDLAATSARLFILRDPRAGSGEAAQAWGELVSGNYFDVLGVKPLLGRFFSAEERSDQPGSAPVAVLSARLWRQQFGGDARIIGRTIEVNRRPLTVIGVAPEEFRGAMPGLGLEVFVPLTMVAEVAGGDVGLNFEDRKTRWLGLVATPRGQASLADASGEVTAIAAQLAREFPRTNAGISARLQPFWRFSVGPRAMLGTLFAILQSASALLLLVVCANVANLLLALGAARRREFALRLALGASGGSIVGKLLLELSLLAVLGAGGGLLLASWTTSLLTFFLPATRLPIELASPLSGGPILLAVALTVLTVLAAGLVPAWQARRAAPLAAIKESNISGTPQSARLRAAFVVAQVALALVALVAAGLFQRSFAAARTLDPGFNAAQTVVARVNPSAAGYDASGAVAFLDRVRARLDAAPGVVRSSASDFVPLGFTGGAWEDLTIAGYVPAADENMKIWRNAVSPGHLEAFGLRLLAGRDIAASDLPDSARVALVNETFAKKYFAGRDPLGQTFTGWGREITIVGVVNDLKVFSMNEGPRPFFWVPSAQFYRPQNATWLQLRVAPGYETSAAVELLRRELLAIDPAVAVLEALPLREYISASYFQYRIAATLLSGLGALTLLLAALGLYGVVSYGVTQRTREVGVRMALGAQAIDVVRLILGHGLRMVAIGVGLGLVLAALAASSLGRHLVAVSPFDPLVYGVVALTLGGVAALAAFLPARRATRIDPVEALRSE